MKAPGSTHNLNAAGGNTTHVDGEGTTHTSAAREPVLRTTRAPTAAIPLIGQINTAPPPQARPGTAFGDHRAWRIGIHVPSAGRPPMLPVTIRQRPLIPQAPMLTIPQRQSITTDLRVPTAVAGPPEQQRSRAPRSVLLQERQLLRPIIALPAMANGICRFGKAA